MGYDELERLCKPDDDPGRSERERAKELRKAQWRIDHDLHLGMNCRLCRGPLQGGKGNNPTPEEVADSICVNCSTIVKAMNWRNPVFINVARAIAEQADRLTPFCDTLVKVQDGKPVMVEITTKHKPSALEDAKWLDYPPMAKTHTDLTGRLCYGGLSAAGHGCEAAFVLVFPPEAQDDMWRVAAWVWTASGGEAVNRDLLVSAIAKAARKYKVADISYDPFELGDAGHLLTFAGVTAVEVRQGFQTLNQPVRKFLDLLRTRRIVSEAVPPVGLGRLALREDREGNLRPDTGKSTGIASPIAALVNAMVRAQHHIHKETTAP